MRLTFQILLLAVLMAATSCKLWPWSSKASQPSSASPGAPAGKPIVRPSNELTGKVVSFNAVGRFAVLNFPLTRIPTIDRTLFLYRDGLKVGEVKITGPQKDDNIVGDLVNGEAKAGDEVRDR